MTDPVHLTRRDFLHASAAGVAASTLPAASHASAMGANDRLNIAVVGVGTRGGQLMTPLVEWAQAGTHNIKVTRVAEVYAKRLDRGLEKVAQGGGKAEGARDYRRVLDDKDVDLVVIATPDH